MKHIMISIKPEWVAKILNGEKILEIRTTVPKEWKDYLLGKTHIKPEPSKWSIYETKAKWFKPYYNSYIDKTIYEEYDGRGKVVAEFTLNNVDTIEICDPYIFHNGKQENWDYFQYNACLDCEQMMDYIGVGYDNGYTKEYAIGFALHIDALNICDKPKELSEFGVKRPPQSWCYVKGE